MKSVTVKTIIVLLFLSAGAYFIQPGLRQNKNRITLSIYASGDFAEPLKALVSAFERIERKVKVEVTQDDPAILVNLVLKEKKSPDLFISPGEKEIWHLSRQGKLDIKSIKEFGRYELVLIAPADSKKVNNLKDLFTDQVETFTIVNPDYNSIGAYAIIALTKLGYWEQLQKSKLIMFTNTHIEALSFISAHKADAGIHYRVSPFKTNLGKIFNQQIKIFATLPLDSCPPIRNYIAVLNESKNKLLAESFIDFIFSSKGRKILSKYGLDNDDESNGGNTGSVDSKVLIQDGP